MMEHQPNEVMAPLDEAARDPTYNELTLRAPGAADKEFRALITKWRRSVLAGG
jgi:hypothetical protein